MRPAACEASAGCWMNVARDSRVEGMTEFIMIRNDHAVIPGSGLCTDIAIEHVVPYKLWISMQRITPAASSGCRDNDSGSGWNHMTHNAYRFECGFIRKLHQSRRRCARLPALDSPRWILLPTHVGQRPLTFDEAFDFSLYA